MTMEPGAAAEPGEDRPLVVLGDGGLARSVCAALVERGRVVRHLPAPDDARLAEALGVRDGAQPGEPADDGTGHAAGLAVLFHDDHVALRYTLAAAHLAPDVPVVSSVFDRTVATQLTRLVPWLALSTPGNLVAPSLAGPCLGPGIVSATAPGTVVVREGDGLVTRPWRPDAADRRRTLLGRLSGQLRPHDPGSRILLAGLAGLVAVLVGDFAALVLGFHRHASEAFFDAARVVATVGPAAAPQESATYLVLSALAILVTVVLTASFTAGLVERLLGDRLVGLVGRRALPRRGHVVVVGLGQVGLRLCQELRGLGLPVVAVEKYASAPSVRRARALHIPVVIGDGEDREVLERVCLARARALAAVASDDIDNIAVAVAAHAVAPGVRVVLRAGQHEAIQETRSLLPLGTTRDVTGAAAGWVVARLLGEQPTGIVAGMHDLWLDLPGRGLVRWPTTSRDRCSHIGG